MKVSKEIIPFQQARVRIPNLGVRCKKLFNWNSRVGITLRPYRKSSDSVRRRYRLRNPV